jgi:hypothetical protein
MDNARHHRRQAELCLQIAELMSDPAAAKLLREAATRHFAEVTPCINLRSANPCDLNPTRGTTAIRVPGSYKVRKQLPERNGELEYRVKKLE